MIAIAFAGMLLVGGWFYNRDSFALVWWGKSFLLHALGVALLMAGFVTMEAPLLLGGSFFIALSQPLIWGGARRFNGLPVSWTFLAAGPLLWLSAVFLPLGFDNQKWATFVIFATWIVYVPTAAASLWRNRSTRLDALWPLTGLFAVHAFVFAGGAWEVATDAFPLGGPPPIPSFAGLVHFEMLLFSMGASFFMVILCKERREAEVVKAARIDPLTGAVNRGAFFESARRHFERCRVDGRPFSVIMFDLDHFKAVNDSHGHHVGDRILADFAETVRLSLRPNDRFGRYGGEEFVVILPGASVETAHVIAERVRRNFADADTLVRGQTVRTTVSAGVSGADLSEPFDTAVEAADRALYQAKQNGRNRVVSAPLPAASDKKDMARIA